MQIDQILNIKKRYINNGNRYFTLYDEDNKRKLEDRAYIFLYTAISI